MKLSNVSKEIIAIDHSWILLVFLFENTDGLWEGGYSFSVGAFFVFLAFDFKPERREVQPFMIAKK